MLITPTGMGAADLRPDDLTWVGAADGQATGRWAPSSESHFHAAVYRARPDAGGVLHTHAVHATAMACLGRPLPAGLLRVRNRTIGAAAAVPAVNSLVARRFTMN